MTVCAHRDDDPGFFRGCGPATGSTGCVCGKEVRDEEKAAARETTEEAS